MAFLPSSTRNRKIARNQRMTRMTVLCMTAVVLSLPAIPAPSAFAQAGTTYKAGDRVECEVTGNPKGPWWMKGTIQPFKDGDFGAGMQPDGSWFRFKADENNVEYPCKPEVLRLIAPDQTNSAAKAPVAKLVPPAVANAPKAQSKTQPMPDFIDCPVEQPTAKNRSKPNAELVKKVIRCKKGEQAVDPGEEGAVSVEVSSIRIGTPRAWSYKQDSGNGKVGTVVYPVKATYTVKTFYRNATEIEQGWVRVFNFYVDPFGEWQIGSEENVKSPKVSRIPT